MEYKEYFNGARQLFSELTKISGSGLFSEGVTALTGTGLDSSCTPDEFPSISSDGEEYSAQNTQHETRCCCSYCLHCSCYGSLSDSSSGCCSKNRPAAADQPVPIERIAEE